MAVNILITGAAGYIGGSLLAKFLERDDEIFSKDRVHTIVRKEEQARKLSALGGNVLQAGLDDTKAVTDYILKHEIDVVINTATSIDRDAIATLIRALGKRREVSGRQVDFIHISGTSAFDKVTGWPYGKISDSADLYSLEKESAHSYIVRQMDVLVSEEAEAHNVDSVIVMPVNIYGRGFGTWNQLSIQIPGYVRAAVKNKQVHKFSDNRTAPLIHIMDLTEYLISLTSAVLRREDIPKGKNGYFFALSHNTSWWKLLNKLAETLYKRDLVKEPTAMIWPSEEFAAESLGAPLAFAHSIWSSGSEVVSENTRYLNWKPLWDEEKLLESLDQEVSDALDEEANKSSLFATINARSSH